MTQAVEEKSIPGFFDEAVYPVGKSRQPVCQGFRPTTADHWSQMPEADGAQACFGLSVHQTSLLQFSLPPLGLFFCIEVQTPSVTLA